MDILTILKEQYPEYNYNTIEEYIDNLELYDEGVSTGGRYSHRWWDEYEIVLNTDKIINNEEIGIRFLWAEANRDESVRDLGWDFNENEVYLVKPIEVKTIKWVKT